MTLTDTQIGLIALCLRLGKERFESNAELVRADYPELAAQFDTKAQDAAELATEFDNAVGVEMYEEYKE